MQTFKLAKFISLCVPRKHWNACGMFVSEQLLYTKETKKDTRLMLTIRHCSLLSGQYSVFSDVVMIYPTMYVLKVGDSEL